MLIFSKNCYQETQSAQFLTNGQMEIKQAAQFLISTLRNSQLRMLNFAKLKQNHCST